MTGPCKRKRTRKGDLSIKKSLRLRNRTKDIDLIYEDIQDPEKKKTLLEQPIDVDLPGLGQFYCLECSRYFVEEKILLDHQKTKVHKRRLRQLKEKPYCQDDADLAAGMTLPDRHSKNR